jgi:hypothetical protein
MHVRQLLAAAIAALFLAPAAPAFAQTAPADSGATAPATGAAPAAKKKKGRKKGKKKSTSDTVAPAVAPAPAPPPKPPDADAATHKSMESAAPAPAPAAPEAQTGPDDVEPPSITHTPVTKTLKGKQVTISARITDPSGVFQPLVYVRKKGMGTGDFIPIKMAGSRLTQGDYTAEIPPALASADLEYYVEAYDNAGNGPARAGSPENPIQLKVEEEQKKIIVAPQPTAPTAPLTVKVQPRGAPPAIAHTAVTQATKGRPVEINAKLLGDTGVQGATVLFRHLGDHDYRALPMGDIGNDNYTATVPAQQVTGDLEYYLEAFDKFGNGPGRSGAPNAPYRIQILEPAPTGPTVVVGRTTGGAGNQPRLVKAPFRPSPGRAAGWFLMAGFVGSSIFAGGEALGAYKANDSYTHTFTYEGRDDRELLSKANAYSRRAKIFGIAAGVALVSSIVLLVVFPEHPDTVLVGGSGGDLAVHF